MEGYFSTGQSPQRAVVSVEKKKFATFQKATFAFAMSVHPPGITRLPLDAFSNFKI
jgi:hypothetical protein